MTRIAALCVLASLSTILAEAPASPNFVIVLERGKNWLPGKSVIEQPLREHGRYLQRLMESGKLISAGPFLDDKGGLILLKVADLAEAEKIASEDPAVQNQIMQPVIHPFRVVFDSPTGTSPFKRPSQ